MQVEELVLVRHGESVGNVADADARRRGAGRLDLDTRDPDTPLSERGEHQARVLARHVARSEARPPDVVLTSPYARAATTAHIVASAAQLDPVLDERLRERDLGILDGLTGVGIRETLPEEAERRARLGKFYYRPRAARAGRTSRCACVMSSATSASSTRTSASGCSPTRP